MNSKKCHKKEGRGTCSVGHKTPTCVLSIVYYICCENMLDENSIFTWVFRAARYNNRYLSENMTAHCLHRRDLSVLFLSIWVLNKMSEVRIQHIESPHDFLDLCLWVPVAGQGSISSVTDPGYTTWVHYNCEKSLFLGRNGYGLHFVTSALDLLLPSWK